MYREKELKKFKKKGRLLGLFPVSRVKKRGKSPGKVQRENFRSSFSSSKMVSRRFRLYHDKVGFYQDILYKYSDSKLSYKASRYSTEVRLIEDFRKVFSFIIRSRGNPFYLRWYLKIRNHSWSRYYSQTRLNGYCWFSGRSRGFSASKLQLSRVGLRELASYGFLMGFRKSSF